MSIKAGIIGCGRPHRQLGATGSGMSHAHARGYNALPDVELVAVADIVRDNALAFQEEHGAARIYESYHEMLQNEQLDMVSICTWPHLHAPMTIDCAKAGVRAVHCEKPMATTFGDAKRMVAECEAHGTQLTFNHQRRFNAPFRKAKEMLEEGRIGQLQRMEARCPNLYDWGTHWFDMMFFYNDETPAEWVIGQIDVSGARTIFGAWVESQGLSHFKFQNGVYGQLYTGFEAVPIAENRLIGSEGVIEVGGGEGQTLRVWGKGQTFWETVVCDEGIHGTDAITRGIENALDALKNGREPELSAHRALRATELIFATWESSRRRGRVALPLEIEDSPLVTRLTEEGVIDVPN
jgi:UDP-N-acetylglucosamine 3-dehydrogenase